MKTLHEVAKEIVKFLPRYEFVEEKGEYSKYEDRCYLVKEDVQLKGKESIVYEILLMTGKWASGGSDRIGVSGTKPRSKLESSVQFPNYNEWPDKITVSINKSPEKIARDIENRFLIQFEAAVRKGIEQRDAYDEKEINARGCARALSIAVDGTIDHRNREFGGTIKKIGNKKSTKVYVHKGQVYSDSSINMELSGLPFKTAMKIINMIKKECDNAE